MLPLRRISERNADRKASRAADAGVAQESTSMLLRWSSMLVTFSVALQKFITIFAHAFLSFVGGDGFGGKTWRNDDSRVVSHLAVMTGIVVMVLYTGNMAAFSVVRGAQGGIKSLEDLETHLEKHSGRIAVLCPRDYTHDALQRKSPQPNEAL